MNISVIHFNGTQAITVLWCQQPADYLLAFKAFCSKNSLMNLHEGENTIKCMGREDFEIKAKGI